MSDYAALVSIGKCRQSLTACGAIAQIQIAPLIIPTSAKMTHTAVYRIKTFTTLPIGCLTTRHQSNTTRSPPLLTVCITLCNHRTIAINRSYDHNATGERAGGARDITMCFEQLHESSNRNELILIDGGMCHWHLRRDGQLTIREIISTRPGAGSTMLDTLRGVGIELLKSGGRMQPGYYSLAHSATCPYCGGSGKLTTKDTVRR